MRERRNRFKASPEGLKLVEQTIKQQGWKRQSAI